MDWSAPKPETMPHFSTFRLDHARLCEALPLVRMAIPEIDPARWVAYCENLIRLEGGVIVAMAADGGLHGCAIYHPEEDLRLGRIVRVDAMVAFELNPSNPVRLALCEAVAALCSALGAGGVMLTVPARDPGDQGSGKARSWASAGFRRHGTAMWKPRETERPRAWSEAG